MHNCLIRREESNVLFWLMCCGKICKPGTHVHLRQEVPSLPSFRRDRLGRSLKHLIEIVDELKGRGVDFCLISDGGIDTTTASGEMVFNIFATLAQFERRLIQERTQAGLNAARARGKNGGRPKISPNNPKVQMAKKMSKNLSISVGEICSTLKISRASYYRFLKI